MSEKWQIFSETNARGRSCGKCTFCCIHVPVQLPAPIGLKPAGVRCPLLCSRGCRVYAVRPDPCRAWSCRWLMDEATGDLRRPDISGYAIDPMLDTILVNEQPIDVIQIWCDPARPDTIRGEAATFVSIDVWDPYASCYRSSVINGRGDCRAEFLALHRPPEVVVRNVRRDPDPPAVP